MSATMTLPDGVTLAVIGLLYANVPAVAVRFYGVPPAAAASIGLLLAIPLGYYLFFRGQSLFFGRVAGWAVAFVVTQVLSATASSNPQRAWETVTTSILEGLLVFLLVLNLVRTPQMLRRVTWTLLLVGSILGFLSGWQYKFGSMRKEYGGFAQVGISESLDASQYEKEQPRDPRASGPVGEVSRYAQIMLMLVPLGFFRYLGERRRLLRLMALGAMGLAMVGIMLSFTRGAAVGFVLLMGIATALRYVTLRQCAVMLVAGGTLVSLSDNYRERLLSLTTLGSSLEANQGEYVGDDDIDTSFQGRDTEMRAALLMYREHPLLGVGPGLYAPNYIEYAERVGGRVRQEEREPHSLYLNIASELGTVGLVVYTGLLVSAIRGLARARRRCRAVAPDVAFMTTAFMLSLVAYLFTGLFIHFKFVRYFWLMLALATAAARMGHAVSVVAAAPREVAPR